MSKNGIFFELNKNDCVQITLNAANLPVALATHTGDVASEDMALITCATDARNVNLPQKAKRLLQWHYRLGHCSFKLVRWLASKGYIKGSVDASSNILCDSCRVARGSQRPIDVEPLAVDAQKFKKAAVKLVPTVKRQLNSIKDGDWRPASRGLCLDRSICFLT